MSLVAILGDVHIGVKSSSTTFLDYQEKFFRDHFFPYLEKVGCKTIIQTGDFFDSRKSLNMNALYRVKKFFLDEVKSRGIDLYMISGNHDCYYTDTNAVNSVQLIVSPYAKKIVDTIPETIKIGKKAIDLYPWISTANKEATADFTKATKSKVAVGHFEFSGFDMYKGHPSEHGDDHHASHWKKYSVIFSGHYHTKSLKDNVLYVGTPYELTWSDYDDPKGFVLYDTETEVTEFVETPFTIHAKLQYEDYLESDLSRETIEGKFVKIVVAEKRSSYEFDKFVEKVNSFAPLDVKVIDQSIELIMSQVDGEKLDLASTIDLIDSFINQMVVSEDGEQNFDPKELSRYIKGLHTTAVHMQ